MMIRFKVISLSVFLALFLCLICVWGCTKQEKVLSDFELYNKGMDTFEAEKYLEARKYFQEIEDLYPNSQYLSFARVGIANTHYEEGVYDEAILAYQKIFEFYPLGKLSEWSQYRIGMSHFRQILEEDRDQEETRNACSAFEKFLVQYPKSPLVNEAQENYQICKGRLAGSELHIAEFYFKNKAYGAAINRLQSILINYPLFTRKDEVLYYLARSYEKEGDEALKKETIKKLIDQYHDSEFTKKLLKEESDKAN